MVSSRSSMMAPSMRPLSVTVKLCPMDAAYSVSSSLPSVIPGEMTRTSQIFLQFSVEHIICIEAIGRQHMKNLFLHTEYFPVRRIKDTEFQERSRSIDGVDQIAVLVTQVEMLACQFEVFRKGVYF